MQSRGRLVQPIDPAAMARRSRRASPSREARLEKLRHRWIVRRR